jgi:hypothetical protein
MGSVARLARDGHRIQGDVSPNTSCKRHLRKPNSESSFAEIMAGANVACSNRGMQAREGLTSTVGIDAWNLAT